MFKLSWVPLGLLALTGGIFTVATMPVSPAQGAALFSNKTTADGLGDNAVNGVYADGSNVYAATDKGLSISTDGGSTFTDKTTPNGVANNLVFGVYADGSTIYAATGNGLNIFTDGGANFTTTTSGLGDNTVNGVYAIGSTVYAATNDGLSTSTNGGASFTNQIASLYGLPEGPHPGSNRVFGVYAVGSAVYAATDNGLSISADSGASFTNKTTANGLGGSPVLGVYAVGSTVYAATNGGLSISADGGASFTTKTTADGLGDNTVNGVYAVGSTVYAATEGGLSIFAASQPSASSASPGIPGIFLAVNEVLVGKPVDGAPVYCGADAIKPNSTYSLSVQSVRNSALTRTVLAAGTVNSRGHLNERFELPALNPGTYKIVMTGTHPLGHRLVLTNYLTVDANGGIVSVSAESQQPFLN